MVTHFIVLLFPALCPLSISISARDKQQIRPALECAPRTAEEASGARSRASKFHQRILDQFN